jgi:HSP20 family protein
MQVCDDPQSTRISAILELPGLQKDDLTIDRQGDRLIVSGERQSPVPDDSAATTKYPVQEFKYGKYRRVINLSPGTQVSQFRSFSIDS